MNVSIFARCARHQIKQPPTDKAISHSYCTPKRQPFLHLRNPSAFPAFRNASTASHLGPNPSATTRQSRFRQVLALTTLSLVFTTGGFMIATAPAIASIISLVNAPSDAESVSAFTSADERVQEINEHIESHPVSQALRADPAWIESRPHMRLPENVRKHSLTAKTLIGPTTIPVPPLMFLKEGEELVSLCYLSTDVCGHAGLIHGGLLCTMLDEGMGRCCFAKLPNKIGVTANLNINYRAPAKAGSYVIVRATTMKVEGRKAWVKGRVETLGEGMEPGKLLVEGEGLFVEPKYAKAMPQILR